jgi:putative peptidoglycan lipid II flippase
MTRSDMKKVGIASAIMMFSVLLSRVIGLFREMTVAYIGGVKAEVDAYQVAFIIPEILNHILASGFLSVTFIPIFSRYLILDQEEEGWKVFSIIFNCFALLMVMLVATAMIFTPDLLSLLAPGLKDMALKQSAVKMTRIIMPAQFFFFTGGLLMAVQFAKGKFTIPAFAPLIYNAGIISGGICLGPRVGMAGFAWGVLGGAFLGSFALQYWGARKVGITYHLICDFFHPEFKKYIFLTIPLMLGLTMTFSTEIFMKFFGSFLPRGSIAGLNYGIRIMFIVVGVFGQAVGVASFPFFARLAAENKLPEMNQMMNRTLRALALVIPISVLFMVLRHEIVLILFQRGKFDPAATELTSRILMCLMFGTFAFCVQTIVARGFYAVQNTILPAIFGSLAVLLSIPLYVYGMKFFGASGVALAVSLSATLQALLLYGIWNKKSDNRESKTVYYFLFKIILATLPIGLFLEGMKRFIFAGIETSAFSGSLIMAVVISALFIVLFAGVGQVLRIEEIKSMHQRLLSYAKGKLRFFK